MSRANIVEHQGIEIVFIDFTGTVEENRQAIREAAPLIRSRPPKSVYTLTYTDQGKFDSKIVDELKHFVKGNAPYVAAAAVVGIKGLQRIVLDAVRLFTGRDLAAFEDVEAAKRYLAGKAGK